MSYSNCPMYLLNKFHLLEPSLYRIDKMTWAPNNCEAFPSSFDQWLAKFKFKSSFVWCANPVLASAQGQVSEGDSTCEQGFVLVHLGMVLPVQAEEVLWWAQAAREHEFGNLPVEGEGNYPRNSFAQVSFPYQDAQLGGYSVFTWNRRKFCFCLHLPQ